MNIKPIYRFFTMLIFIFPIALSATAQQAKDSKSPGIFPQQKGNGNYTYRLFIAPNKVFGYDVFLDNKIVYHQPATAQSAGNKEAALVNKTQADKAATVAIDKIKRGIPAELTNEELSQITGH